MSKFNENKVLDFLASCNDLDPYRIDKRKKVQYFVQNTVDIFICDTEVNDHQPLDKMMQKIKLAFPEMYDNYTVVLSSGCANGTDRISVTNYWNKFEGGAQYD